MLELADRPGEIPGLGPVDPWLARDLARAAAANPTTTWCLTVTDQQGHAIGHGCARPAPKNHENHPGGHPGPGRRRAATRRIRPAGPAGTGQGPPSPTASARAGPPGGYGSWRLATGIPGQRDLAFALDPIATGTCDHRFEAAGHHRASTAAPDPDPGTGQGVPRRPCGALTAQADFEHNTPSNAGSHTCLCNGGPKCRHDHRLKQDPRWQVEQITPATFRWTAPSGRTCTTEPTRYPDLRDGRLELGHISGLSASVGR